VDEIREEMQLHMEHAERCLASAWLLLEGDDYPGAINRAYYCVFHSTRALFANDFTVNFKRHASVVSYFREKYVKTGIFDKRLSDIIGDLLDERIGSDYDCSYSIGREEVEDKINDADHFLAKVREYLGITPPA